MIMRSAPPVSNDNDNVVALAERLKAREIPGYLRTELRQMLDIHKVMFDKLLFQEEDLPLELAELFEDVGNRYLDISDRIIEHNLVRRGSKVE